MAHTVPVGNGLNAKLAIASKKWTFYFHNKNCNHYNILSVCLFFFAKNKSKILLLIQYEDNTYSLKCSTNLSAVLSLKSHACSPFLSVRENEVSKGYIEFNDKQEL